MNKRILAIIMSFAIITAFTGCEFNKAKETAEEIPIPQYPVHIENSIITESPVKIATISPAMTDLIYGLGFGGRVVAVGDKSVVPVTDELEQYKIKHIGTSLEPDMIAIKKSAPDVLFTHAQLTDDQLRQLQQMYVTVVVIPYAETLDDIFSNYEIVSKVMLGETDGKIYADKKIARYKEIIEKVSKISKSSDSKTNALYLRMMSGISATGDTFENYILNEIMGFENAASEYTNWNVPNDKINELNPNLILYHNSISKDEITENDNFKNTDAVKDDKVIDTVGRYFENRSPQMFMELVRICYELYPDKMPADLADI